MRGVLGPLPGLRVERVDLLERPVALSDAAEEKNFVPDHDRRVVPSGLDWGSLRLRLGPGEEGGVQNVDVVHELSVLVHPPENHELVVADWSGGVAASRAGGLSSRVSWEPDARFEVVHCQLPQEHGVVVLVLLELLRLVALPSKNEDLVLHDGAGVPSPLPETRGTALGPGPRAGVQDPEVVQVAVIPEAAADVHLVRLRVKSGGGSAPCHHGPA
mmetsp:Transcript_4556/g.13524  ORF Transcript_4556/g.13524 Transcript_4556/m.13524 type:complete len:216 (-) Transcript_4556:628-1275(-)